MSHYKVIYSNKNKDKNVEFKARLVGVINNEEARAILNTDNAPKAVFTSASLDPSKNYVNVTGKRLVLASTTLKKDKRVIIITPEILFVTFRYAPENKYVCFHTAANDRFDIAIDS